MTRASQRDLVAEYFAGFRASDHERILATLTDDVEWVIHGHRTTRGLLRRPSAWRVSTA
ncbi:hypothetical protein [Micromonospora marina]|uniref:hypothetical protein n=1 Tax=Micromonospora marina TaxID=307120 RepID=UPI003452354B